MTIIHLIAFKAALLLVYRTNNSLYSYQILFWDDFLYRPQELYPRDFTALKVGLARINILSGSPD